MPFSGTTFTNVAGAESASAGDIVQSATWNAIHEDYADALTQLMNQLVSGVSFKNALWMNGGFEVWQRGAGSNASISVAASTTSYTCDRFYIDSEGNAATVSAQTGLSTQSRLCARVQRDAAETGTDGGIFGYPLDTEEIIRLRGKIITLSGLISAGANWSPTNGTLVVTLYGGTGSVSKRGAGFTGETAVLSISTNLTPGGAVVAISGNSAAVFPTTATQAEVQFTWTPTGTADAADYFSVDDLQLEADISSDTWTPNVFDRVPFTVCLSGCKRHYQKTLDYGVAVAQGATVQNSLSYVTAANQSVNIYWQFPVECRVTAGITTYNPSGASANWQDVTAGASIAVSVDSANSGGSKGVLIYGATATATLAAGNLVYIQCAASAGI